MLRPTKRLWLINYLRQPVKPIYGLIWLMLTTYLCLSPASALPSDAWFTRIPFFDKLVHVALFSFLTFCWLNATRAPFERAFILVALLLFAWMIEYIQSFIPGRSFELVDILADAGGMALAASLILWPIKK
jgi:VanZ family protein